MVTTVTSKGQVTIPKAVRDRLKLQPGDQVDFAIDRDGEIKLLIVGAPIKKLKGIAPKPPGTISLDEMQAVIENGQA
jgi:AbrB family looped-hinge helix DNA binding protein